MILSALMEESIQNTGIDMKPLVCILTAGKGSRMGSYSEYINKSLLPIDQKAVISHIISKFPSETEFIIGLGHFKNQVREYLQIAHPCTVFHFVEIDNYDGIGSGPGYSLLCCRDYLQRPFYFVSCDTLWNQELDWGRNTNWVAVSKIPSNESEKYCNFAIEGCSVIGIRDKEKVDGNEFKAFTGLCRIRDYERFWTALRSSHLIEGEYQISNGLQGLIENETLEAHDIDWVDVGNIESYRKAVGQHGGFDFSKNNEFFYKVDQQVIKFFTDESVVSKRVEKTKLNPDVFPVITRYFKQFYAYDFLPGHVLYQRNDIAIFKQLLEWLDENLWLDKEISPQQMIKICREFYYNKTVQRLSMYRDKYGRESCGIVVNGVELPPLDELLDGVPWDILFQGKASFIHGDLQFDNILYTDDGRFVLLDWRQDFGGLIEIGDIYYDLAKLCGGIILNYDYIKLNLLNFYEDGRNISIDFAQRYLTHQYLQILSDFVRSRELDMRKVRLLVPLIYLNMSPLHHYPFDKLLFALGWSLLFEELHHY